MKNTFDAICAGSDSVEYGKAPSDSSQLYPQASVLHARALVSAMANAGYTVRALSKKLGVSPNTINALRHGRTDPGASLLRSLADALGVTMDELWPQ